MFAILSNTRLSPNLVVEAIKIDQIVPYGHSFIRVTLIDGRAVNASSIDFARDETTLKEILSDVAPERIKRLD